MATQSVSLADQLHQAIDRVPADRQRPLLKIIEAYQEAVDDDIDPVASLRAGLQDAAAGRVHPIESLWDHMQAR